MQASFSPTNFKTNVSID